MPLSKFILPTKPNTIELGGKLSNTRSITSKRRRGGVLRYPLEALTEHTDYLQIDIEEYVALGGYVSEPGANTRYVTGNYFGSDRAGRRRSDRLSKKPLINTGTILLPIPSNVQDTNNVQYDSSTLNGLAAAGIEGAEGIMNIDLGKNVFQQIPDVANTFKNRVTQGIRNDEAAKNVVSKMRNAKKRIQGYIENPLIGQDRVENFLDRFGPYTVILGRFIPAIRPLTPFLLGITDLNSIKFYRADVVACLAWGIALILLVISVGSIFE